MHWVLIVMLHVTSNVYSSTVNSPVSAVSGFSAEFNTKEACDGAAAAMRADRDVRDARCFPKGDRILWPEGKR